MYVFFFKQKTAYEMRISDWSSDVCSSDLELLSHAETQKLLDDLPKDHQKLIADMVPAQISVGGIQRVLQSLLGERVSILDLPGILEGISEACGSNRNITSLTEHDRPRHARQTSKSSPHSAGLIHLINSATNLQHAFTLRITAQGRKSQTA